MRGSCLITGFAHFYKVRKIFGILLFSGQRKKKTKRFRYVRGGKQTPVCPRTVHSSGNYKENFQSAKQEFTKVFRKYRYPETGTYRQRKSVRICSRHPKIYQITKHKPLCAINRTDSKIQFKVINKQYE